jgi:hypothetical protein
MWAAEAELTENIELDDLCLLVGSKITVTKGLNEAYCLWHQSGLYDLESQCVGEIIKIISN